jgi:hypothetical protein
MNLHDGLLILRATVLDALEFASFGEVGEGYEMLLVGKYQAPVSASRAKTWAEDLEHLWEAAMAGYQARYAEGRA